MTAPTTMTPFNLPLDGTGTTLIEASAGTGKTYALTTLAARLIVEAQREISDLLIVTFTVAATDELRDRLRRTLRAVQSAAAGAGGPSDQARDLMAHWASLDIPAAEVGRRLEPAVMDLDRANVLTIHGFCQRVINDFAFDCGLPFGFEVSGDGFDVMSAEVRDHWRRSMVPAPKMRVQFGRSKRFLPKVPGLELFGPPRNLTDWVASHSGKPGLEIRGAAPLDDAAMQGLVAQEARWETALDAARSSAVAAAGMAGLEQVLTALEHPLAVAFDPKTTFAALAKAMPQPADGLGRDLAALDEASAALLATYGQWLPRARRATLEETRARLSRRIREERLLGYDDLLLTVREALNRVPTLAARIRQRYRFALIDEYQDTGRAQADIFQRIYGGGKGPMVIVGDPKQSIYRFRSADIFAYLRASASVADETRLTLGENYRSVPRLVEAVNTVFDCEHPFGLPEIPFSPATPAEAGAGSGLRVVGEEDAPPLQFRVIPPAAKPLNKNEAVPLAASHAADEIARLLAASAEGNVSVDGEPLAGSDIAVLVRTGEQGRRVASALAVRGVRSVEIGTDDVFESREAEQLERLLWAVASPHSTGRMRGALAGDLFGLDAAELTRLADDDDVWNAWKERLGEWRTTWHSGGVAAMVRQLLKRFDATAPSPGQAPNGGARQLLRHPDGARRLTNVMHLADLLQQAEATGRLTPPGVAAWFSRRRGRVTERDEVAQLRLESDEQLVKIVTVHRSKGLEFPIVFLPFAWDVRGATRRDSWDAQFHVRDDPGFAEVLHLAPTDAERGKERLEGFSEDVRLLYVALTRARLRCVVTWGRVRGWESAPLAWLLREPAGDQPEDPVQALDVVRKAARKMTPEAWLARLQALVVRCPHGIGAVELPAAVDATRLAAAPAAPSQLRARRLSRALGRERQMTSYSALGGRAGAAESGLDHEAIERPDHDLDAALESADQSLSESPAVERSPFTFPTGARVGSCLHEMFERRARGVPLEDVVSEGLARHHIDAAWRDVATRMVENTWAAPLMAAAGPGLGDAWRIADLTRPVPELEFHLPARRLGRDALGRALGAHGYSPPFGQAQEETVNGYLRGFIDLVAEWRGCWYVIDYKTNLLGRTGVEYSPPRLADAVRRRGYQLQYLLYLLALHRHLRLRLPDYDYERHIGGAFYLFARGIDPAANADPARGIFFDRPSAACIHAMDACFAGSESP